MTGMVVEDAALQDAHRFNRKLAWAPRFKMRNRVMPALVQALLRASQVDAGRVWAVVASCR